MTSAWFNRCIPTHFIAHPLHPLKSAPFPKRVEFHSRPPPLHFPRPSSAFFGSCDTCRAKFGVKGQNWHPTPCDMLSPLRKAVQAPEISQRPTYGGHNCFVVIKSREEQAQWMQCAVSASAVMAEIWNIQSMGTICLQKPSYALNPFSYLSITGQPLHKICPKSSCGRCSENQCLLIKRVNHGISWSFSQFHTNSICLLNSVNVSA